MTNEEISAQAVESLMALTDFFRSIHLANKSGHFAHVVPLYEVLLNVSECPKDQSHQRCLRVTPDHRQGDEDILFACIDSIFHRLARACFGSVIEGNNITLAATS